MDKNKKFKIFTKQSGVTLYISIVIMGVLLLVSFAVANITLKGVLFSSSGRDSQLALFAAEAGIECAIYWDNEGDISRFDPMVSGSLINCASNVIRTGDPISGTTTITSIGMGNNVSVPENISFVNSATGSDNTWANVTSISTNSFNVNQGNLIVVTVRYNRSGSQDVVSVTDSGLNNYQFAAGLTYHGDRMEIWYARNSNQIASNVVTATLSGGAPFRNITAVQYSGIDKISPLDVTSTGFAPMGVHAVNSGAFTTNTANQLIVSSAQIANTSSVWTVGGGHTFRVQTNPSAVVMTQDRIVSSIQNNITVGAINVNPQPKSIVVATFRAGSIVSGGSPNRTSVFGFNLQQLNNHRPCTIVQVTKNLDGSTQIKSSGYNTCDRFYPRRVERGVEVNY